MQRVCFGGWKGSPAVRLTIVIFSLSLLTSCAYVNQPPPVQAPRYYIVQDGETLSEIARRFNRNEHQLGYLNNISNLDVLQRGQRLYVGLLAGSFYGAGEYQSSQPQLQLARSEERQLAPERETLKQINYRAAEVERPKVTPRSNRVRSEAVTRIDVPPKRVLSLRSDSGDARLSWPIRGGRVVSNFGPRRKRFHDGVDIAAKRGTPVYAAHDGVIIYSGNGLSGYGNLLLLRARDGLTTVYAHNKINLVRVGALVSRGEQIAEVGRTGRATGPHLHFEVRMKDNRGRFVALDPLPLLSDSGSKKPRFRVNEKLNAILAKVF